MKIIIHAGRHKTGTTYLQQFFGENSKKLLKENRILYPESEREPGSYLHHKFFECILAGGHKKTQAMKSLSKEIVEGNPDTVLFSSEYLSRSTISECDLENIKDSFSGHEIELIFYLRRQDHFLCSYYAERVKRNMLSYPDNIFSIDAELDYNKFLERYENVFGHKNLIVRSYDNAKKLGLVTDFASCLNIPEISKFPSPRSRANSSLPWGYLRLLHLTNSNNTLRKVLSHPSVNQLVQKFQLRFPTLPMGRYPLTESEAQYLKERYSHSNYLVSEKYFHGEPIFSDWY